MEVACAISVPPYSSLTKSQFCLGWQCEQSKWLTFSDSLAAIVSMWLRSNQHDRFTDWKCYYLKSKKRTWWYMSFPFAFILSSSIEWKFCTWKCRNHLVTMRKEDRYTIRLVEQEEEFWRVFFLLSSYLCFLLTFLLPYFILLLACSFHFPFHTSLFGG